jgi:hypothetical protein
MLEKKLIHPFSLLGDFFYSHLKEVARRLVEELGFSFQ